MNMKQYQEFTRTTAIYPDDVAVPCCVMGLCGEAGEVANKVNKVYRYGIGLFTVDQIANLKSELGDVL